MKKIKEEIGRNYRTVDDEPNPYNYSDDISVVINGTTYNASNPNGQDSLITAGPL